MLQGKFHPSDRYGRRNLPPTYIIHEEMQTRFDEASREIEAFRQKKSMAIKKETMEYIKKEGTKVFQKKVTDQDFTLTSFFLAKFPHLRVFQTFKFQVDYSLCFRSDQSSFDTFLLRVNELNNQVRCLIGNEKADEITSGLPDPIFLIFHWLKNELGLTHVDYVFHMTHIKDEASMVSSVTSAVSSAIVYYTYKKRRLYGIVIKPIAFYHRLTAGEALYTWLSSFLLLNLKENESINGVQEISQHELKIRQSKVSDYFEFLYRETLCTQFRPPTYARRVMHIQNKLLRSSHLKKLSNPIEI